MGVTKWLTQACTIPELLSSFPGDDMSSVTMRFWLKGRDKLIHNYLLVGYLILSNPTIMAHVNENRSEIHQQAVVSLIKRLILSPWERIGLSVWWSWHIPFGTNLHVLQLKGFFAFLTCGRRRSETLFMPITGISTIPFTQ